ncbi:hypothetical protein BDN70DRAFT_878100 [Pholiota conissans]|uniref:Uncharacterized protein n=1 Tax=Pholiota conissans TaxID=109636 RepID=A0A9P5Z617_9AGAR|nr:hypothetical protein BDN70DRAFT_878100 [Pholiota conissans]
MAHPPWPFRSLLFFLSFFFLTIIPSAIAYEVPLLDTDYSRQICSGMWGGPSAYINVSFDAASLGNLAMVIYEWKDVQYLGKETISDEPLPKTYICTSSAETSGYCTNDQLGRFILNLPAGTALNTTSFWSARLELPANKTLSGFWDNPEGNPTPPKSNDTSPWRRDDHPPLTEVPSNGLLVYSQPIHYPVSKTGFYCVAAVPLTVDGEIAPRAATDVPFHPTFKGSVLFKNTFDGQLPATDYPKVTFYFIMFVIYAAFALTWGWFCYRHIHELLPIQYYLSGLVGLLVIEMFANWVYYRYLNAHGRGTASTVFLIVVAILDAGRNSMSFFMLLVVALGLSVVRESLGRVMLKCQALAVAHFIFGILYAIGIVELELESTSALILLIFIIPLAFTLSGFLLWIMYALNATIAHLRARKQHFKLRMFERLYYILLFAVFIIAIFFVVSTMSFSGRLAEDYTARTWRYRWWLLDGYLSLLYLVGFVSIAFLWRPSENNRRLAMSDELAQDEQDAEDYDLESLQRQAPGHPDDDDDDAATLVAGRHSNPHSNPEEVVFEIGDEDDDDEDTAKKRKARVSGEAHEDERHGLMRD